MTGGPTWIAWFWWIGGWIVALAGFTLLLWAMIRDRSRGRRRCPKCWYDLSATTGLRCSECGREAKRERKLFKTRRRWRWAGAAIVLLVAGYALWVTPRVQRDGWFGAVPTTALIAAYPWALSDVWRLPVRSNRYLQFADHFEKRIMADPMWRWQMRWAVKRTFPVMMAERDPKSRKWGSAYRIFGTIQLNSHGMGDHLLLAALRSNDRDALLHAVLQAELVASFDEAILVQLRNLADGSDDELRQAALGAIDTCLYDREMRKASQSPSGSLPR